MGKSGRRRVERRAIDPRATSFAPTTGPITSRIAEKKGRNSQKAFVFLWHPVIRPTTTPPPVRCLTRQPTRFSRPLFFALPRRRTVTIGKVKMGSEHPIVRQTMTTSDTRDVEATVAEVRPREKIPGRKNQPRQWNNRLNALSQIRASVVRGGERRTATREGRRP